MTEINAALFITRLADRFKSEGCTVDIKTYNGRGFLDVLTNLYEPILSRDKKKGEETLNILNDFFVQASKLDGNDKVLSGADMSLISSHELFRDNNGRGNAWLRKFCANHFLDDNGNSLKLTEPNPISSSMPIVDQGSMGNCFHLAAFNALTQTARGVKYLQDLVTVNSNGYTVHFKPDKKMKVTKEELEFCRKFDLGFVSENPKVSNTLSNQTLCDLILIGYAKVLQIELSARQKQDKDGKFEEDQTYKQLPPLLKFVFGGSPIQLLTNIVGNNKSNFYITGNHQTNDARKSAEHKLQVLAANKGAFATTVSMSGFEQNNDYLHALMLDDIDWKNQTVYLRNPWDSNSRIAYSYEKFFKDLRLLNATPLV